MASSSLNVVVMEQSETVSLTAAIARKSFDKQSLVPSDSLVSSANNEESSLQVYSSNQMKLLLDHARKVIVDMREHIMAMDQIELRNQQGAMPTYDQLVLKLENIFTQQRIVNAESARLMSVNYLVHLGNFARNRQLAKIVAKGRKQVLELQNTVQALEVNVDEISTEMEVQKEQANRFAESLNNTQKLMESTLAEYREELKRQDEELKKQQKLVGAMNKTRFNQDFIVDSVIFLISLWAVNTMVVDLPIAAATTAIRGSNRRRVAVKQGTKVLLFILMIWRLKALAKGYGLHNSVGAFVPYVFSILFQLHQGATWTAQTLSYPFQPRTTTVVTVR
ncbi:hypothetical protein SmJEL517_g05576 [Synchytrium microbalum]|uniref:Uncharacterized protein n=1 Tax=Synchytrium microbalum TaxID=1806994 RepID=A0A507BVN5_9FUNG|nr:uncharacterized protein SmJEL517_g05576 [Synchytrium microbalum]TPX30989.1 hypothetical protein SmJEL517_g05576 [Synchytrium microbalum]